MHTLIIGRTASGKTTLAKQLAEKYMHNDTPVYVLDPFMDNWPCEFITDDRQLFLEHVWKNPGAMLFVDESGEMIGRHGKEMNQLATRARHYGHHCHFISQRLVQVDPNTRMMCSNAFLFKQSLNDAKTLSDEFADPSILEASDLPQGVCIVKIGHGESFKLDVFKNKL